MATVGIQLSPEFTGTVPSAQDDQAARQNFTIIKVGHKSYKITLHQKCDTEEKICKFTAPYWDQIGKLARDTLIKYQSTPLTASDYTIAIKDDGLQVTSNSPDAAAANPTVIAYDSKELKDRVTQFAQSLIENFSKYEQSIQAEEKKALKSPESTSSAQQIGSYEHNADALYAETAANLRQKDTQLEGPHLVRALAVIGASGQNKFKVAYNQDHGAALDIEDLGKFVLPEGDPSTWFLPLRLANDQMASSGHFVGLVYIPAKNDVPATLRYYDSFGSPISSDLQDRIIQFKEINKIPKDLVPELVCQQKEQNDGVSCGAHVLGFANQLANPKSGKLFKTDTKRPTSAKIQQFRMKIATMMEGYVLQSYNAFAKQLQGQLLDDSLPFPELSTLSCSQKPPDGNIETQWSFQDVNAIDMELQAQLGLAADGRNPLLVTYANLQSETTFDLRMRSSLCKDENCFKTPNVYYPQIFIHRESYGSGYLTKTPPLQIPASIIVSPEFNPKGELQNESQFSDSIQRMLKNAIANGHWTLIIGDYPLSPSLSASAKNAASKKIGEIYNRILKQPEFAQNLMLSFIFPQSTKNSLTAYDSASFRNSFGEQSPLPPHTPDSKAKDSVPSPDSTAQQKPGTPNPGFLTKTRRAVGTGLSYLNPYSYWRS